MHEDLLISEQFPFPPELDGAEPAERPLPDVARDRDRNLAQGAAADRQRPLGAGEDIVLAHAPGPLRAETVSAEAERPRVRTNALLPPPPRRSSWRSSRPWLNRAHYRPPVD